MAKKKKKTFGKSLKRRFCLKTIFYLKALFFKRNPKQGLSHSQGLFWDCV
jgi:hypothetical protein